MSSAGLSLALGDLPHERRERSGWMGAVGACLSEARASDLVVVLGCDACDGYLLPAFMVPSTIREDATK